MHSRFRSNTDSARARDPAVALIASVAIAGTVIAAAGCGGQECGPGAAPDDGITIEIAGDLAERRVVYGDFTSSPNNDCTPPGQEVTSLTVEGRQVEPPPATDFAITFCLPRPQELGGEVPLTDSERIQVIDVNGDLGGCTLRLDSTAAPAGTAEFAGYCGDGSDPAGYALRLSGSAPAMITCGAEPPETVTLELSGEVAVEALVF